MSSTEENNNNNKNNIYQEAVLEILPSDFPNIFDPNANIYTPRQYEGPKDKVRRFHNFPRFGHSNDITALVSFHENEKEFGVNVDVLPEYDLPSSLSSSSSSSNLNQHYGDISLDGNGTIETAVFENVPNVRNVKYNSQDAKDYITGIAVAGIIVMVIYLLWGIMLLLLRAGRMDCCFRLCGGRRNRNNASGSRGGEEEENDVDEGCCLTCHNAIYAKGGCCTRNVLCGWMAGRPPKLPTKRSLRREEELKQKNLVKESASRMKSSVISGVEGVKSGLESFQRKGPDDEYTEDVVAETAVPGAGEDPLKPADDNAFEITEDYVRQRRESTKKTLLILRILFLFFSALVLVFCSTLLQQGYSGINSIVYDGKHSLTLVEGHVEKIMAGVEAYLEMSGRVREKRLQFLNGGLTNVSSSIVGGLLGGDVSSKMAAWCPAAATNNGTVDIEVPMSNLLLKGNLVKLAYLNDAEGGRFTVLTFLDKSRDGGRRIRNGAILRKILSLRNDDGSTDNSKDESTRINNLLDRLRELVGLLVLRAEDRFANVDAGDNGQVRLLENSLADTTPGIAGSTVSKDGQDYIVLSLDDKNINWGDDIVFRGYNLTALFTTNITLAIKISELSDRINESLNSTSDFFTDTFQNFNNGLENLHSQSQNAQDALDDILPYYYVAVVFVSIVMFLTCIFILGTALAWKKSSPRFFRIMQDNILLPMFIICGLFVWIFTTVFLTLGVLSGDFCVNTPDVQVNKILEQTLSHQSEAAYNFAYYYVNGCPSEYRPNLAQLAYLGVQEAKTSMADFYYLVQNFDGGFLANACGSTVISDGESSSLSAMASLSFILREHLQAASEAMVSLAELLLCRSFHPLYSVLMYDLVCGEFVNMIALMLWSMFLISISSMVMVTLRVAWHELAEEDDSIVQEEELGEDVVAKGIAVKNIQEHFSATKKEDQSQSRPEENSSED